MYSSEEEQIEAMKKWWRENGTAIVVGVVVGVGALFGWQGWQKYKISQAESASAIYTNVMNALDAGKSDSLQSINASINDLQKDYAGTPYAALASLAGAKVAIQSDDAATAKSRLQWVIDNAGQPELADVARLRLARIHLTAAEWDAAARLLNRHYPESFSASVNEMLGDMHAAQGKTAEALEAYNRALSAQTPPSNRDLIQIKRDALAEPAAEPESKPEEAKPANA